MGRRGGSPDAEITRALAGPFRDRADIGEASPLADESWEDVVTAEVYGVRDVDGRVERRVSPADKAFEAHLSDQLDRVSDGDGRRPSGSGGELALEVAAVLVDAGFALHDCTRQAPTGGVCVTPLYRPQAGAVAVTWSLHERMVEGPTYSFGDCEAVKETMNVALAEVLRGLGFELEQVAEPGRWVVIG